MENRVTVACVLWGDKYGTEYVTILKDMVKRNLSIPHRFVCLSDREIPDVETMPLPEGLEGWWNKIELFRPGRFEGRVMFLDLDVVITGGLDELAERKGIIQDWHLPSYNSSVMVWDAGEHEEIFTQFQPTVAAKLPTDQDWMTLIGGWEMFPASWCVSYRSHSVEWPPLGSRVVCFHGSPKPHEVTEGWVPKFWCEGGMKAMTFGNGMNVDRSVAVEQMRKNCEFDLPWLQPAPAHAGSLVIVGGAPSLLKNIDHIRNRQKRKQTILAVNQAWKPLVERGVRPDIVSIMDARPENVEFVKDGPDSLYLVASQAHPSLICALEGKRVCLWHACIKEPMQREILDGYQDRPAALIGGGGTVGLRMLYVGFIKGYRRFHLYGMDSCFSEGRHHAYPQSLNDDDQHIDVIFRGKHYDCAPWMARQANEFKDIYKVLRSKGCSIAAHGTGLLPDICSALNDIREAA